MPNVLKGSRAPRSERSDGLAAQRRSATEGAVRGPTGASAEQQWNRPERPARRLGYWSVTDDPLERISVDPAVCHGQPCVRGTRVLVTVVLDALAAGLDTDEILGHSPTLTAEGVRAAAA